MAACAEPYGGGGSARTLGAAGRFPASVPVKRSGGSLIRIPRASTPIGILVSPQSESPRSKGWPNPRAAHRGVPKPNLRQTRGPNGVPEVRNQQTLGAGGSRTRRDSGRTAGAGGVFHRAASSRLPLPLRRRATLADNEAEERRRHVAELKRHRCVESGARRAEARGRCRVEKVARAIRSLRSGVSLGSGPTVRSGDRRR